jgi:L-alanine-DL-glutamate epimerase-like enolase superfamily enzyme
VTVRARLFAADIRYGGGLTLHTATSGAIAHLSELYLLVETKAAFGLGEARVNIPYLNGLAADVVTADAQQAVAAVEWRRPAPELLATFDAWAGRWSAPVRMLLDVALHDLAAREAGVAVADLLGRAAGSGGSIALATNQTLFWSPFDEFVMRAEAYVARGFRDLKVRVAAGDITEDLRRVAALRDRFGTAVTLAIDANGCWSAADAARHLDALAPFDLAYAEQPIAAGDWPSVLELAARSPVPIMLDEGVASADDVARIAAAGGRVMAHLKLVKLGGMAATASAARTLSAAGAPFMIGQMNEGHAATAAAMHVAAATGPRFAELYAADGLIDDPASGVGYRDGLARLDAGPGLGVAFDPARAHLIQEVST